jgi:ADP-ribose pyrophosphatase YjhB (NUDIX family)
MEIKTKIKTRSSGVVDVVYRDIDSYDEVRDIDFESIGALVFCDGKLVLVHDKDRGFTPVGGKIEKRESLERATEREVKEESNMRVLKQIPIGYQTVYRDGVEINQTRVLCVAEPYGPFVSDPDGDILGIKIVEPRDYKKYFDYGEIQDHIMNRIFSILKI